ncbi:MerR family transcriptional regulator [Flavihumibacter solisilvae]|uniref:MerR family transcriptional regulator n=1 Tax=Flavihumibacter solisilvae TaxID=1349421 RepID=UPI00068E5F11|nr:MerR family transcriptional regulator [Flavihumibacter solisilvae]
MNAFTIKDLENLSGIKAHTIRIWEQRYNFLKPQRTQTNIRTYTCDELKAVLNIALLNKYGYKISHIDKMCPEEIRDRIVSLGNVQAQQERIVNEMIQHMVDLETGPLEDVLDNYISLRGIDKTITQVIFPFLEKIGILWLTNHINPAQEHLVSNIVRQKLIVGIEGAFSHVNVNKTVLLFLPEGENHEIGLLYTYYLLKSRGVNVLYLGANVPLKDVEFVANLKKPEYLYTHLTSVAHNFNFEKFLNEYTLRLGTNNLVVSGLLAQQYRKKVPENVHFKCCLPEVFEFVAMIS